MRESPEVNWKRDKKKRGKFTLAFSIFSEALTCKMSFCYTGDAVVTPKKESRLTQKLILKESALFITYLRKLKNITSAPHWIKM